MSPLRYLPPAQLALDTVTPMPPADVTTKAFSDLSAFELHELLRLRCDVFVVEQACVYADIDGRDDEPATRHHWIDRGNSIVAYARTLADPDGATRIGRVVTARRSRGEGLAARLVSDIISTNPGRLVLDAQSYLVEWYQRFGFVVAGPEFVEDGIPHVPMSLGDRRELTAKRPAGAV